MTSHQEATYREERTRLVRAPAATLWSVVSDIGGERGYFTVEPLWRLRALADRLVGGPGMRGRGPGTPAAGEVLDFWRVEESDPPHTLLLRAEMRMPGTAWWELAVEPRAGDEAACWLVQRTFFAPAGLVGHAFWWAELPGHLVVLSRMCDNIARAAEEEAG